MRSPDRMTSTSTPNDDSSHQTRRSRITRTALTGLAAKAAMVLPTLLIAKVVLPIIGTERFGILITVLSMLALMTLAEMGIGSSLITAISRALGAGREDEVRQLQANGLALSSLIGGVLLMLGVLIAHSDVGSLLFPAGSAAVRDEATRSLTTFWLLFSLCLPLTLVNKIQLGLQAGHIANHWQIAAALINFALGCAAGLRGMDVPWIIAGMMSGTLICGVANLLFHLRNEPKWRPRRGDVDSQRLRSLLQSAGFYFALQVIFTIAYSMDTTIVARGLGPEQAAAYALSERIFSIVAVSTSVITAPLWAAYGEAIGRGDMSWVRRTLKTATIRIAVASLALSAALLLLLQPLIHLLSSGQLTVPWTLAASMAAWRVIEAIGASISVYLYACQRVRFILAIGSTTALASLAGKVVLLPHFGVLAVPITMLVCYSLMCLLPSLWAVRRPSQRISTESLS
jgi:O-antigen/teichoic acid export membrane protein